MTELVCRYIAQALFYYYVKIYYFNKQTDYSMHKKVAQRKIWHQKNAFMYVCLEVVTFYNELYLTYMVNILKVKVCNFPGAVIKDILTLTCFLGLLIWRKPDPMP